MKNGIKKAFLAFVFTWLLVGCNAAKPKASYNLDMEKSTLTIKTTINDTVSFVMETNPTTGYSWQSNLAEFGKQIEFFEETVDEFPAHSDNPKTILGAPLLHKYEIKFLEKGNFEIHFNYLRAWETNKLPIKQKTVFVVVE